MAPILLAVPAGADDTDLVRRIFSALDLAGEIARVAPGVSAGLDLGDAPAADRERLRRIVETGFDPDLLERLTLAAFLARFDLAHARAAAAWLARPEIARLHAAGRAAAPACEPDARDRDRTRAEAIARISAATSVESRARRNAPFVLAAMLEAASAALPEARRHAGGGLAQLPRVRPDPARRHADACRYRELSTAELVAAQAFVTGETGRWLYGSTSAAVEEALVRAARATARRIVDAFDGADPRRVPLRVAAAAG
jgi:hypothetical protein